MARYDSKGRKLHTGESEEIERGSYKYRYIDPRSGKRNTIYAQDLADLRKKEKEVTKDLDDAVLTDASAKKLTVNALFDNYMNTTELAPSTRSNYERMWQNQVADKIGNIKVVQLRSSHIKSLYATMSRAGYSHNTIKIVHTLLYPALELAVDDDMIRKNPARNCLSKDYGTEVKEKEILSQEQQEKLISFMEQSNIYNVYVPMFTIFLETALRCGELIGLNWEAVNLKENSITIDHQLIYKNYGDGAKFHISSPKTKAGNRTIPLSQKAQKAFVKQKEYNFMLGRRCEDEIEGYTDFIFLAKTGRPLMPSAVNNALYNVIDAYNKDELKKAKKEHRKADLISKISVHCLRHTACTNLARLINVKSLQYIMGHAHSDVTMDVYNHLGTYEEAKEEMRMLEKIIG